MPKIKVILCVAYSAIEDKYNTYIIGDYDEDTGIYTQPYLLREDLIRFKKRTTGHVVVMGRHTWEAIGSKPLPNRTNVVITSKPDEIKGALAFTSIKDAVEHFGEDDELFFIGGAKLIEALQKEYKIDGYIITFVNHYSLGNIAVRLHLEDYFIKSNESMYCTAYNCYEPVHCYFTTYVPKK